VSTGADETEVRRKMRQAIEFHIDGLKTEGQPVPRATSKSSYIEVAA
jgi:predicted RNase H-like HicB family nuclease